MSIFAVDPSLRSTGVAYDTAGAVSTGTVTPKKLFEGRRLFCIRQEITQILDSMVCRLVVMEKLIGGPNRQTTIQQAELVGVLKLAFWERNIPVLQVPPSSLKLFATGKGNADKDMVRVAMSKHRGDYFKSDDEADAYALLQMGRFFLDPRLRPRDRRHYTHRAVQGCVLLDP